MKFSKFSPRFPHSMYLVLRHEFLPLLGLCFVLLHPAGAQPSHNSAKTLGGPILPTPQKVVDSARVKVETKTSLAQAGVLGGALSKPPNATESDQTQETDPSLNSPTLDISAIRRLRVGGASVAETPMPVGKLDILAPISTQFQKLGISVTRAALENVPGNPQVPTEDVYFQINRPGDDAPPIIMAVGKRVAYINHVEQPLKAPPFVIKDKTTKEDKLWLPILSLAPLIGAAPRLAPDGTLHLNPTIQSVEIFLVKGVPALTIKTSAPIPDGGPLNGGPQIGTLDNPRRLYIDFPGYALGLDAVNTPTARVVAPGAGDVSQVRAGLFQQFPDTARVTLDLKTSMRHTLQTMPDRTIFAMLVYDPNKNPEVAVTPPPPDNSNLNVSLQGVTIVVDAGHGGHDVGAKGKQSYEKNHALDIAQRLKRELDRRGATVLMTRDGDYFVTLQGRCDFANSRGADLFISCHIDSAPGGKATGSTTYYSTATSQPFAREVQNELAKATRLRSKGIIQRRLFVTRNTTMPAVLTETCYINNPREEKTLMDPNFRQRVAAGLAQGISNYIARYGKPKR
ncbi:MAG TPA: N-acetylmuramoyl-L-alanine amidase [Abditibacteriaceae bacterium]